MLKASGKTADGRIIVILGLSRRNCELLLEGRPIVCDSEDFGLPHGVVFFVVGGESEQAILEELQTKGLEYGFPVETEPETKGPPS